MSDNTDTNATFSTFVGHDKRLPSLDWTADVAIRYRHFKKTMSHHAGKTHPFLPTVIDTCSDTEALAEIVKQYAAVKPTPTDATITDAAAKAEDELRYDMELLEYRLQISTKKKEVIEFHLECGKFYFVVLRQLSSLIELQLTTIPDYDEKVKNRCSLSGLFESLDQVILGN